MTEFQDYLFEKSKNWIPKDIKKNALHKQLGIPEDKKLPMETLKKKKELLQKKAEGDKKLSAADSKLLKRVNFAITMKRK